MCTSPRPALEVDTVRLSETLVDEASAALAAAAVSAGTGGGGQGKQSPHPAPANRVITGSVVLPHASALWVTFDSRCSTANKSVSATAAWVWVLLSQWVVGAMVTLWLCPLPAASLVTE